MCLSKGYVHFCILVGMITLYEAGVLLISYLNSSSISSTIQPFLNQFDAFLSDPPSTSLSWLALLFVTLSLAVNALEDDDPLFRDLGWGSSGYQNIRILSTRYRTAAMRCLAADGILWGNHTIESLQALVLLIYAINHAQGETWASLGERSTSTTSFKSSNLPS